MKRHFKTLAILVASLFLVASGVNAALDRLAKSPEQSTFTVYNDKGVVVLAYNGDLNLCKILSKPAPVASPIQRRS